MPDVLNLAAYRFVDLHDLPTLRDALQRGAAEAGLRGTILLAPEGINLFLAGAPAAARGFVSDLARGIWGDAFAGMEAKESWSRSVPFQRLRVRIKREIIRLDDGTVRPASRRAPGVTPHTLRRWLDAGCDDRGRELVVLDTRNAFEVAAGSFAGAVDWGLQRFGDFPAALAAHAPALRNKTVVSFCTGGIRCEKAALLLREHGLDHGYQLDGGILRYFEELPSAPHWRGHCVVFDDRQAVRPDLSAVVDA